MTDPVDQNSASTDSASTNSASTNPPPPPQPAAVRTRAPGDSSGSSWLSRVGSSLSLRRSASDNTSNGQDDGDKKTPGGDQVASPKRSPRGR